MMTTWIHILAKRYSAASFPSIALMTEKDINVMMHGKNAKAITPSTMAATGLRLLGMA